MHLFFKLIKQLNEPRLSKSEWEQLNNLYSKLSKRTAKELEPLIKDKQLIKFKDESTDSILMFIHSRLVLIDTLYELNKLIDLSKNAVCGADTPLSDHDKNTILFQLLPNNLDILTKSLRLVELFLRIDSETSATNSLLTNFLTTLTLRISQLENHFASPTPQTLTTEQLTAIYKETYNQILINKLLFYCRRYKQDIETNVESYLKNTDEWGYLYCKNFCRNVSDFLMFEIQIQQWELEAEHTPLTPLFKLFLVKYSHIDDLIKTLTSNKHDTHHKLTAFAERFEIYRELFRQKNQDSNAFFKTVYADEVLELEFIKTCDTIASEINLRQNSARTAASQPC